MAGNAPKIGLLLGTRGLVMAAQLGLDPKHLLIDRRVTLRGVHLGDAIVVTVYDHAAAPVTIRLWLGQSIVAPTAVSTQAQEPLLTTQPCSLGPSSPQISTVIPTEAGVQ